MTFHLRGLSVVRQKQSGTPHTEGKKEARHCAWDTTRSRQQTSQENSPTMSLKVGDDDEPLSKKRKHEMEPADPPINVAADFPMMENEATARSKLREAGFDPDASVNQFAVVNITPKWVIGATPMIYFCRKGDIPMCEYLLSKGASTTKESNGGWNFPMQNAALGNSLEACKWLYVNGAQSDVRRVTRKGRTPLGIAAAKNNDELLRWLVLHGALCADDNTDIVECARIRIRLFINFSQNIIPVGPALKRLAEWATTATQPVRNPAVVAFLCAALPPKSNDDADSPCILQYYLSGEPGIRQRIADFAGKYTKRQVSILRQVRDELPPFLACFPEEAFRQKKT